MITRGKRNFVRRFIENLEEIFLPYVMNGRPASLQLVPREITFWEVAFPEPMKNQVLSMIGNDPIPKFEKDQYKDVNKLKNSKGMLRIINWIAGKFGLEMIPEEIPATSPRVSRENVGVHLIGTRKDRMEAVVNEKI